MRLAKAVGLITAQVDEVQVVRAGLGRQMAELDFPAVDTIDRHPRIDMHTLGAAKPGVAQLWVGGVQRIRHGEYHVMDFDPGPWVLAPEHYDKQHCRPFPAIWQRATILRLNPFVR